MSAFTQQNTRTNVHCDIRPSCILRQSYHPASVTDYTDGGLPVIRQQLVCVLKHFETQEAFQASTLGVEAIFIVKGILLIKCTPASDAKWSYTNVLCFPVPASCDIIMYGDASAPRKVTYLQLAQLKYHCTLSPKSI